MELWFIIASNTDQCERIADQHGFDSFIKWRRAAQGGQHVDLKNPRLLLVVQHYIEPVHFEAVVSRSGVLLNVGSDMRLYTEECLHDDVFELGVHILIVDPLLLKGLFQHLEVPLWAAFTTIIVIVFTLIQLVLILHEVDVLLVHWEVCQVYVLFR